MKSVQSAEQLSPEMKLLFACIRWPQRDHDIRFIQDLLHEVHDWQEFLLLARHHRLAALVSHNLTNATPQSPAPEFQSVLIEFHKIASANTFNSLHSLAELRRLSQLFASKGIAVRVLKGLPLAKEIFGDLSLRMCGDIDLMIDEEHILEADQILRGCGYRGLFEIHRLSPYKLEFYRLHWKDVTYQNPETLEEIDLHWRLFRNREMPGGALLQKATGQTISFGNFEVVTLPRVEHLLYLCVHGTIDGWLYMKSLSDVAAQVRGLTRAELDSLAKVAATHGILSELTVAMILVRRYIGMDNWSTDFLPENDRDVTHSLRFADRIFWGGKFLADRTSISSAQTDLFEWGLRRKFRFRREVLIRIFFRLRMWQTFPLPDRLFSIYPVLSPVEWMVHRIQIWLKSRQSKV